ncbi:MAG TPA: hypothetical protein PKW84_07260 [Fervidobacterium sp.]|nr:hypothetical protein [Fervidobacterium sp.]
MDEVELEKRLGKIDTNIALLTASIEALRKDLSEQERSKDVWNIIKSKEHQDYLYDFVDTFYAKRKEEFEEATIKIIEKWKNKTIVSTIAAFIPISSLIQVFLYWLFNKIF